VVAVDGDGIVRSRGVANTLDQVEEMLAEVLAGPPIHLDTSFSADQRSADDGADDALAVTR
jgi:hypothetical protein